MEAEERHRDRANIAIGVFTALVAFLVYLKTVAPSISFWDCGEFVAASVSFGMPHPPGSPVYILFGRIFSVIPFGEDLAFRVNMLSVLSSTFAVLVAYFVITRIIGYWSRTDGSVYERIGIYLGGFVGALSMGFNRTFWTNAVEAEVYGLMMLIFMLALYLMIRWYENHESPQADRLLVLAVYVSMIGVGVHLSAFLAVPAAFIFIPVVDRHLAKSPLYWISAIIIMVTAFSPIDFLYIGAAWSVVALIGLFMAQRKRMWRLALLMTLAGIVGFSIQFYVPVRSALNPPLDENNPDNWERFTSFVERKQYGEENMIPRMLTRRGQLEHQFGDFPRMGFWRFFSEQYADPGVGFMVMLMIGLVGMYYALRAHYKTGGFIVLLVLAGTVGLTLYMNFADGTLIDPRTQLRRLEVRDRDYFWTNGFAMFGLCIGLGVSALYRLVREMSIKRLGGAVPAISVVMAVVIFFMPFATYAHNSLACDRSLDTLPYDYAYNVLNTCGEGAFLFTAGDNDTFPLWALQWGLGIRQDVRVINLSLLDTDWYAIQMRDNFDVPISLTDEQILQNKRMIRGRMIPIPDKPYYDPIRKQTHLLTTYPTEDGTVVRVAHQLTENILLNNQWEKPVYFANYPPSEVGIDLVAHCKKVGIIFQITREEHNAAIDTDESHRLFTEVYQFRNLDNPEYYRDETQTTMALGLGQKWYDTYSALAQQRDTTKALEVFDGLVEKIPEFWQASLSRHEVDSLFGREGKTADEYREEYLEFAMELYRHAPDSFYYKLYIGMALSAMGRDEEALAWFQRAFEQQPTSGLTYRSLVSAYISTGEYERAVEVSKYFLFLNPLDGTAKRLIEAYEGARP